MSDEPLAFTDADKPHIETTDIKTQKIRDAVRGVATHHHTGLLLCGPGGTGKSYTAHDELKKLKVQPVFRPGRITAKGLVDLMEQFPSHLIFLEDCEHLFADKNAPDLLRQATHSQSKDKPMIRPIAWTTGLSVKNFLFTGGIILIVNQDMDDKNPCFAAIKTRIIPLNFKLSNEELLVIMKRICQNGFWLGTFDHLEPDQCWEVGLFIRGKLKELNRPLNLRLLEHGFKFYIQWLNGESKTHWEDMLLITIQETITKEVIKRRDKISAQEKIALEINQMDIPEKEKYILFQQKTGHKNKDLKGAYLVKLRSAAN